MLAFEAIDLQRLRALTITFMKQVLSTAIVNAGNGIGVRLAEACSVTPQTISKWRHGQTSPPPHQFATIEGVLALEPGTLVAAMMAPPEPEPVTATATAVLTQLVADMRAEVEELREQVQRLGVDVAKLAEQPPAPATAEPPSLTGAARGSRAATPRRLR